MTDEKREFTYRDHLLGMCNELEIGMEWEDRWSKTDAFNKECTNSQVGKPKTAETAETAGPNTATPAAALNKADRKRLLVEMSDALLVAAHSNPMFFASENSSQINKFIEMASKLLDGDDDAPRLAELTAVKLRQLPTVKRYLSILSPALALPEPHRQDMLDAWGMTAETIETMVREMQDAID